MYGLSNLKPTIQMTATHVECPVMGCTVSVPRQRRTFKRDSIYQCPEHGIFISPSTFEYPTPYDNLLWKNKADLELLDRVRIVKREGRFARDRSEDALSWNLFRYLEKTDLLSKWLSHISDKDQKLVELIYWSYSQTRMGSWIELNKARKEFGENLQRSSEPDLIAVTDTAVFFIEVKLTAKNEKAPSNPTELKKYLAGGNQWFNEAFISDYEMVAIKQKRYELLRFWLLGSWLAKELGKDFYLINLVPALWEVEIETLFIPHIKITPSRVFKRLTWEDAFAFALENGPVNNEKELLKGYFDNKTIGYDRFGVLRPAFTIDSKAPFFTAT